MYNKLIHVHVFFCCTYIFLVHMCIYKYMPTFFYLNHIYIYIDIRIFICVYLYVSIKACIYIYVYVCLQTYDFIGPFIHLYVYMYIG
jgi:hypothetical protein